MVRWSEHIKKQGIGAGLVAQLPMDVGVSSTASHLDLHRVSAPRGGRGGDFADISTISVISVSSIHSLL